MKTQALVFTVDEIKVWLAYRRDHWAVLPLMVYGIISMCFAGRGVEVKPFDWSAISREFDGNLRRIKFVVKFIR